MQVSTRLWRSSSALARGLIALLCALLLVPGPRPASAAVFDSEDGGYAYGHTDLRIHDDPELRFTRTYTSLDARSGPLGRGWTHNFNIRLLTESQGGQEVVTVLGPFADDRQFSPLPDGRFKTLTSGGGTLIRYREGPFAGTYELVGLNGTRYELDVDGRATEITYPSKTTVALVYDEADRLHSVTTRDGSRRLSFGYDGDSERLVSLKDWLDAPREIRFGYDDLGRLTSYTDRLGATTRYAYHGEQHLLKEIVNARGQSTMSLEYNPDGTVMQMTTARSRQRGLVWTTMRYETLEDGAPRTTQIFPASAYAPDAPTAVVDTYDADGKLVRREWRLGPDEESLIQEFGYDRQAKRVANPLFGGRTAPAGAEARCVMDAKVPGAAIPLRVGAELRRSPIPRPRPITMPLDRQEYDDWELFDEAYDEAGRLSEFVLEQVDGEWSERWKLAFDAEDHIVSTVVTPDRDDRPEQTTLFRYDLLGNLIEKAEPSGEVTHYEYDDANALTLERRSGGETVRYEYDNLGHLARTAKAGPDGAEGQVMEYVHDGAGRLRRAVEYRATPDGVSTVTTDLSYRQFTLASICRTGADR